MNENLEGIAVVAAGECIRQHVGLDRLVMLLNGYRAMSSLGALDYDVVTSVAGIIEPENNGRTRKTPVTFMNGGSCANHEDVDRLLLQIIDAQNGGDMTVDQFVREFLWIHPFVDGNGRTAWVLYNWLTNRMNDPAPLPDYGFGS